MKHLLIILSLLILTFPLIAQEAGVLYFKKVNGKYGWFERGYGWFESGNDKKDWRYKGEIKKSKPNGTGVLSHTSGKYYGELNNGVMHGFGTYTFSSGRRIVGEFRNGNPWNVKSYDINGKIVNEWIKGINVNKEEVVPIGKEENAENISFKIGVRALLGNTFDESSTSNLIAQETGVLYFKKVNGKYGWFKRGYGWFESGNDKKDWKYIGEIKKGKPHGTGELSHTFGKYSGELKNGVMHGFGTYTFSSGRRRVGQFRKGNPWNVKSYDINGKIVNEWIKGININKEEVVPIEEKDHTENISYKIGVRVLLGSTSGDSSTTNSSVSLIWENYGLGINQMAFESTSPKNQVYEMKNSSLDLSYTLDMSYIIDWSATAGLGYLYDGKGKINSASTGIKYETESVSGYGLFGLFGIEWEGIEGLTGVRYYSTNYTNFKSTNKSDVFSMDTPFSIAYAQLIFGLGYNF